MDRNRQYAIRNTYLLLWLVLFIVAAAWPQPAGAHAELVAAEPAAGAALSASPAEIRLTFNEPVTPDSQIVLYGEGFQPIPGLAAQLEPANPAEVYAAVPELAPGGYTVQWTAVSADGHEISGSYSFSVGAPFTETRPAFPWWQTAAIGALVLIAAAILRRYWRPRWKGQRGKETVGGGEKF